MDVQVWDPMDIQDRLEQYLKDKWKPNYFFVIDCINYNRSKIARQNYLPGAMILTSIISPLKVILRIGFGH